MEPANPERTHRRTTDGSGRPLAWLAVGLGLWTWVSAARDGVATEPLLREPPLWADLGGARAAPPPGPGELRAVPGLGRVRAARVARALWDGGLALDAADAAERLEALPGIGPWTVRSVLHHAAAADVGAGPRGRSTAGGWGGGP